jgi:hypothetical protein
MDCQAFHKNLEDYLQDGLDFAGRFGMERHAQQCFNCGKELADAQNLRRLVAGLARVKAPANFESSVSKSIAQRRTHGFFHRFSNYWSFSFEWPSWQRTAMAVSTLAILGFALFFAMHREKILPAPPLAAVDTLQPATPLAAVEALPATEPEKMDSIKTPVIPASRAQTIAEIQKGMQAVAGAGSETPEVFQGQELPRAQSVDYLLVGPDNQPAPDRMPSRIYMRYGPPSEEYFISNVSH